MGSNTGNTTKDWRDFTSTQARELAGKVRRMAVSVTNVLAGVGTTTASFWQVVGHLLLDNTTQETADAEVFSGVGFYARPPSGANAEAIVAFPGGPANPVVVASRDEATRKKMAPLAQDETAMFNSRVAVYATAAGKVEARADGGTAISLATKADIDALATYIASHIHGGVTPGTGPSGPPAGPPPHATGTQVLMGQ